MTAPAFHHLRDIPIREVSDDLDEWVVGLMSKALEWKEPEKTEDWMRRHLRFESGQNADRAGQPVDVRTVPHARLIFDFLADPWAEELNIMKSSAAGLSTSSIIACLHRLDVDPCNILYLITNREEAIKLSKNVWQPFMRQRWGEVIVNAEEQGNLHMKINGCDVFSGSPTGGLMRNKQVGILIEDESDTMSDEVIGSGEDLEGSQRSRTKGTKRRKIIRLCTPLYAYNARQPGVKQPRTRIHRNWGRGDKREFRVPCPACEIEHTLHEDDFHCDSAKLLDGTYDLDAVEMDTHWKCPACQHIVNEGREKWEMMQSARWVPTAKGESRRVWSAKFTDWNSLIGNVTWGQIKKELIRTKGTLQEADVRRNHLAEPEDVSATSEGRTDESILRHCGTHERGVCPVIPWRVVLTVDVQKGLEGISDLRFPWMKGALHYRQDGRIDTYVIDWGEETDFDDLLLRDREGRLHGLYTRPTPIRLAASAEAAFRETRGTDPPSAVYCTRAIIDSGYKARGNEDSRADESDAAEQSVYAFCVRSYAPAEGRFLFCPVKGRAGSQINSDLVESSVKVGAVTLPLLHYDDPAFKRDLYNIRLASDPARPSPLARDRGRIILPRQSDVDDVLISHLKSERIAPVEVKDKFRRTIQVNKWKTEGANDLGDCLKWMLVTEQTLKMALLRHAHTAA